MPHQAVGISGKMLRWMESFFATKKICIDDLHTAVSNTARMFADHDTKLFTQGDTVAQEAAVQDNWDCLCYLVRSSDWQGPSKV